MQPLVPPHPQLKGYHWGKVQTSLLKQRSSVLVSIAFSKKGIYWVFMAWFGSGRATELASVRRHYKLSLCLMDPMPAGTKVGLLLAKAEPIRDVGNTSEMKELKRGKGCSVCSSSCSQ